jgi:pyridoxal phosphate phosphatase PHOSPHO2
MRDTLRGLKERNIPVIIMSDANTLYIEAILKVFLKLGINKLNTKDIIKVNGVRDCVSDIITNPNYYDDKGRVRIHRRVLATDLQHECIHPCNVNICKGKELDDMMQRYKPKKMAYTGDGKNDFCPATRLKESDVFFMRDGRGLESYLVSEPQQTNKLIAKKIHWVEPNTVLENILDFFDK